MTLEGVLIAAHPNSSCRSLATTESTCSRCSSQCPLNQIPMSQGVSNGYIPLSQLTVVVTFCQHCAELILLVCV